EPGVPRSLEPYADETLLDVFARSAREDPEHPTLLFKGAPLRAAELARLSDAFARFLVARGIGRGDRVATLLPNCPQAVIAMLGAWKAGAVLVPLNPLYAEEELRKPLAATGVRAIVVLTPFYERVKRVQASTRLTTIVAANIKEHLPPLLRILFTLLKERREGHRVRLRDGDLSFPETLRAPGAGAPAPARPDDTAFILLSGGTTGTPKGVLVPHRGLSITARQLRAWVGRFMVMREDRILLPLPLFHAFGCIATLGQSLIGRNPLILVPNPRDLGDVVATIRRDRPAFFVGVPTLYNALLNHAAVRSGRADFRSMKLCFSSAAPLLLETHRRFETLTGGRLVEGYSLTEAGIAAVITPLAHPGKPGSVGTPLPDVDLRIVDAESGERELPRGEVGEVLLRAPQIMPGYLDDPEETAVALRRHDEGPPWLHTGDLGYLDEDGFLFLVDRKKDLIKISGLQVWPREIEEAVAEHPKVAEVAVAGVPDPARGEVAKAWVVLREGQRLTLEELREHCKGRLAPFKAPALLEVRRDLPKSMVGKVLRRVLVAEHRASVS
ncbi:MAG TPA: AMP-binding protein, partial [Vicinamibacteria bacterium]|nr:AMP-binding protein [Vicinamibacteria bacterium]